MKDYDSDSFSNGQKSKLDIVGPNHLRIQTVKLNQSSGDASFPHHGQLPIGHYTGRYQCPTEGQARIAEYLDLAKGCSVGHGGLYNPRPYLDPLSGTSRDDSFQKSVPVMSRGTNGVTFGIPGNVLMMKTFH